MIGSRGISIARLDSSAGRALCCQDLTAMHIAGMRERNTAGGGALDAIAAFRPLESGGLRAISGNGERKDPACHR
jgi:hypothetical protein